MVKYSLKVKFNLDMLQIAFQKKKIKTKNHSPEKNFNSHFIFWKSIEKNVLLLFFDKNYVQSSYMKYLYSYNTSAHKNGLV